VNLTTKSRLLFLIFVLLALLSLHSPPFLFAPFLKKDKLAHLPVLLPAALMQVYTGLLQRHPRFHLLVRPGKFALQRQKYAATSLKILEEVASSIPSLLRSS
jgi:hypothetical protein